MDNCKWAGIFNFEINYISLLLDLLINIQKIYYLRKLCIEANIFYLIKMNVVSFKTLIILRYFVVNIFNINTPIEKGSIDQLTERDHCFVIQYWPYTQMSIKVLYLTWAWNIEWFFLITFCSVCLSLPELFYIFTFPSGPFLCYYLKP